VHFTECDGRQTRTELLIAGHADTDRRHFLGAASAGLTAVAAAVLAGCAEPRRPAPVPPAPPGAGTGSPRAPGASVPPPAAQPLARSWAEYRVQAARRLVQANPGGTYLGDPPEPLLAIPVLEIELYVDGSIQKISVQREPRQALDTVQLAINAVRRAAPFPPVGHLPKPWRYTEVFLFDDQRRFKPRTLDN
jgi:hypothetical protein